MLTRPARFARPEIAPMTAAPACRILVDLSHAADGYVGVAQDLRLIFSMLCEIRSVAPAGLLMPAGRHDLPIVAPGRRDEAALTAAVLHSMERNWEAPPPRRFPFWLQQQAQILRQILRRRHHLLPLSDTGQLNALWRVLFAKTLLPEQRALVLEQSYYATDLSVSSIIARCVHPPVPQPKHLAAEGFDAVLFCMPRPVRLPPGVRQIVRFHDAVPVTDTDTVGSWRLALMHSRLVRACAPDAIFVCNSPQSLEQLLRLDPSRERHALVIPCALAALDRPIDGFDLQGAIGRHVTFRALGQEISQPPARWVPPAPGLRYVLSVSTLEPRKNFASLIRAWERVATRCDPDLRLIIVGGPGWRESAVLSAMRPGVESGRILHLQNVPQDELQALMRGAACFAFPSFNEGFGYSPLEAMQAGAPCVVSDIPVFRWTFEDSAVFVDPYDVESIAAGIARATAATAGADLRRRLRQRSAPVLSRFQPAAIRGEWQDLLETLPDR